MSETGEYCIRCYGSSGLNHCRDCIVQALGLTRKDVEILRASAEDDQAAYDNHANLHALANRIEALLDSIK